MSENKSDWPDDPDECVALARADFIDECAGSARYWLDWGIDRLIYEQPAAPFALVPKLRLGMPPLRQTLFGT